MLWKCNIIREQNNCCLAKLAPPIKNFMSFYFYNLFFFFNQSEGDPHIYCVCFISLPKCVNLSVAIFCASIFYNYSFFYLYIIVSVSMFWMVIIFLLVCSDYVIFKNWKEYSVVTSTDTCLCMLDWASWWVLLFFFFF